MKSNTDGTDEDFFIDASLHQSTPLTVDESIKRVYWLNQDNETILSASLFGGNSEVRGIKSIETVPVGTNFAIRMYFVITDSHVSILGKSGIHSSFR